MENLFDKPVKRRGTGSLKWDVAENELPMWVADMDFETAATGTSADLQVFPLNHQSQSDMRRFHILNGFPAHFCRYLIWN